MLLSCSVVFFSTLFNCRTPRNENVATNALVTTKLYRWFLNFLYLPKKFIGKSPKTLRETNKMYWDSKNFIVTPKLGNQNYNFWILILFNFLQNSIYSKNFPRIERWISKKVSYSSLHQVNQAQVKNFRV